MSAKNKAVVTAAVHAPSLANRAGYDEGFLNKRVPLPGLGAKLKKDIPKTREFVGRHGDQVLDYTHFSVVYNKSKKLPFYTAVNIDGSTNLMGMVHEERASDVWLTDNRITTEENGSFQFGDKDYAGAGFQKGHLVRYFDPAWGSSASLKKRAMGETFHYTNCCPQIPYYNSVVWNYLEDYYMARSLFVDKKITVFSGPIFNKAKVINGLLVPLNFWKVVVYNKGKSGIAAMGFIMSQEKYFDRLVAKQMLVAEKMVQPSLTKDSIARLYAKKELMDAKVKISTIEEKTSLRFGLGAVDEKKNDREGQVELVLEDSF